MSLISGCSRLVVYRDGVLLDNNATTTPYIDPTILIPNTSYIYSFTPYDLNDIKGVTQNITIATLSDITSAIVYSKSLTEIVLHYEGTYTSVSITRNGVLIATNIITETTFTDTGLTPNTSYTYIIIPFGINNYTSNNDQEGIVFTLTTSTIPDLETIDISYLATTEIVLEYTGYFTSVSILRNGVSIATNVSGTTFTDTGLTPNTSYTYIVTPYNSEGDAGVMESITHSTLPNITSLSIPDLTTTQIVLEITGNYTSVSIYRNGAYIANITGNTFTDTGLTVNTSYTYIVTPYNTDVDAGTVASITHSTLPVLTSLSITSTTTEIVLLFTGNYTSVSIYRNGIYIATNITGTTFTYYELTPNTSYTYIVIPYNSSGDTNTAVSITKSTLPNITSLSISGLSIAQIVLLFAGNYTSVNITRNGTSIATNNTGTTFTDSGLAVNTSYTYIVTPIGVYDDVGTTALITKSTLPNLTSVSFSGITTTGIVLLFTGNYTNLSIIRNGASIGTGITASTFTDSGLTANTSYTYTVIPYNSDGDTNTTITITKSTIPNIISLSISDQTITQISLEFSGNYTSVSIYRNGIYIATDIIGTTFTDTGLTVNTTYTYTVIPIGVYGDAGTTATITHSTLPNITSVGTSGRTTTQIVLVYAGNYTNVSIIRNGTSVATNITGITFTDTGLIVNTSYTYIVTPYNSYCVGTTATEVPFRIILTFV